MGSSIASPHTLQMRSPGVLRCRFRQIGPSYRSAEVSAEAAAVPSV